MVNDRKDKYEGNQPEEEGEYHFSEDEVSYEVESDTTKTPSTGNLKESLFNRFSGSKRIILSLVGFLILIFIIYKVITPSTPSLNITPQAPSQAISANPPPIQQIQPVAPVQAPITTTTTTTTAQPQPQPTGMPVVIPVQTPAPAYPNKEIASEPASGVELRMATMVANDEKLMTQLQADYTQKLNDFAAQNKALQDQLQAVNTRVGTMETQMNQLIQMLTRQNNSGINPQANAPQAQAAPEVKIPYSVQAIIPGRAWLRSDNGETITVAEGDMVKGVGRVTKIDPYDGVVEINTGTKTISLSYGAGG